MYKIEFKNNFTKKLKVIKKGNKFIFEKSKIIVNRLLLGPPFEKIWNVHNLLGDKKDYFSINITGDWRIVFVILEDEIIVYDIGTHSELYN